MEIDVKLPELGENIESGSIASILVAVGEHVEKDDPILELETDKAVVEVPSTHSGLITNIHINTGDTLNVGDTILNIDSSKTIEAESDNNNNDSLSNKETVNGEHVLDTVALPQVSEKTPDKHLQESQPPEKTPSEDPATIITKGTDFKAIPATPTVRRLAREIGVDIESIKGSGPKGRIMADDVKNTAKNLLQNSSTSSSFLNHLPQIQLPDFSKWGSVDRTPMNPVRRKTAEHLTNVWNSVPMVTQQAKADITDIENYRKKHNTKTQNPENKITLTAILTKIVATALKVFPQFNASVDTQANEIILKSYYRIGIAVDTERGLLVPIIPDADKKNIIQIAKDLTSISIRARERKLSSDEMAGGTFSISNLGSIGGSHFTPIVNSPEVAILGVSRAENEPVWLDESFVPRLRLPLSLTYDHRVIDGADGMRFLRWVVEAIEQPLILSMEG